MLLDLFYMQGLMKLWEEVGRSTAADQCVISRKKKEVKIRSKCL